MTVRYAPWAGEAEWLERQAAKEIQRKAEYVKFIRAHPGVKCVGCAKEMSTQGEGRVVGGDKVRCLPCQRDCR